MRRRGTLTLLALATLGAPPALSGQVPLPGVTPRPGLLLTSSARLLPGTYRLGAPASPDSAAITLRGDDLTLDLTGVTLEGSDPAGDPDRSQGVAIRIVGGRNVRIVGGRIRGYQVAVLARGTRNLRLSGIDASDNWRPRLYSGVEHESLADWLSFHHNEQDEWLRYGAGFYLSGVHGGELRANRVRQGMNGLLLVRSDSLRIEENDFSFNSGLGIGLYRSRDNRILANRLDFNVRGYSHGFYRRGQDSAGLLLYEQSTGNLVAWNSATHGGDGLFLWAGQQTMDSGQGGANDNLFYRNDFSFAPANAMEATFSRNAFVANRAVGSDYGLWGGYSFGSRVIGNCFAGNRTGIAIEHGQDNVILGNRFVGDSTAIALWGDPIEPSDWGYPKHRDTRSRDYRIEGNRFEGNRVALRARNTAGLKALANRYVLVDSLAVLRDTSGFLTDAPLASGGSAPAEESCEAPQSLPADLARLV
ncbi:MAG TPA: NosD domain-containing protein, partial [Gemmatimonadales bacterium]|nr:NosD domain-containing protein [Gemmatimonadales bacterium]